jgi:SAM-dependent methyltransferase
MRLTSRLCKALNSFFPLPVHPFNLQNQGKQTYAEWQYEKGADTLEFFLQHASLKEILAGRQVLDIGCGAGGKTLFYAAQGAAMVYGVDVVERYAAAAHELARAKGLQDRFRFVLADAAALPFGPDSFDVIIMNDAMEHVDKPLAVLQECYRVLRPGGRLYVNFPPYYHPFGAHLSDAMGFPWVQLFSPTGLSSKSTRIWSKTFLTVRNV